MKTYRDYLYGLGFSNATVDRYYNYLLDFTSWADGENAEIDESHHGDFMSYITNLKSKGLTQSSIAKLVGSLKHYYNWLIRRSIRTDNPVQNIKIKGVSRNVLYHILTRQELDELYAHFPSETIYQKRDKIIVGLLVYQGLHGKDLLELSMKDVDLRLGKIKVKSGRRSNERSLDIQVCQMMDLIEYQLNIRTEVLKEANKESDLFIVTAGDGKYYTNAIYNVLRALKKKHSKVKNVGQINASVITHWVKQHNLRKAQYLAGHRYVSSTERYLINDMQGLQDSLSHFHPGN